VPAHWATGFQIFFPALHHPPKGALFANSKREGVLEAKLLKESMTQTEITREIWGSGGWGASTKNLLWEGNEYFLEQHNFLYQAFDWPYIKSWNALF